MNTITRWLKNLWMDDGDARRTLGQAGLQRLEQSVQDSEARHLGELRLCVEGGLPLQALWRKQSSQQRAIDVFSHLRVWDTEHNNGVLIYLLLAERRLEILADRGLHGKVSAQTWQHMAERLSQAMQNGEVEAGLTRAVTEVGELLKAHYPASARQHNPNELPNAVALL
jgi:uncharacterized membrane protein YgcG